jgi:peptidoglycan/xylan/chitin deacetylase (PgdA/CDA1 family)
MNVVRQGIKNLMTAVLPRERWLVQGPPTSSGIALTFDDGPHPEYTPRLLDELARYQIRATFFVVGQAVARFPDITRRIVAEGHTLGGHTYTHSEPDATSARKLIAEVLQSRSLIEDLTQVPVNLFRPPKGKLSLSKTVALWQLQQTIVLWNQDPRDYQAEPPLGIVPWVQAYLAERGDIVLLHDTHPYCIAAVEPLVQRIADAGLGDFQTFDEWLPARPQSDAARQPCELNLVSAGAAGIVKKGG